MRLRSIGFTLALLLAAITSPIAARSEASHLKIGYSLISEFLPAFVAADHGSFARHGVVPELVPIANAANVPASVISGSVEIGGMNIATFLHAIDGGVDLVAVAGSSMIPNHDAPIALVTAPDWTYADLRGLEGKSIAMPGIGSAVDVLFRTWIQSQNAEVEKVRIVEVPLPQIPDSLRTHSIDSAVLVEPFLTRAVQAGQARMAVRCTDSLPHAVIATLYAADRRWAERNKSSVAAFRAAIAEGVADAQAHKLEARQSLGHYIKLPPEVLASLPQPAMTATITADQVAWWVEQMRGQNFLQTAIEPASVILP